MKTTNSSRAISISAVTLSLAISLTSCSPQLSEKDQFVLEACHDLILDAVWGEYTYDVARSGENMTSFLGLDYTPPAWGELVLDSRFTDVEFLTSKVEEDFISGTYTAKSDKNMELKFQPANYSCLVSGADVEIAEYDFPQS
jgi:hypothetical protein